MSTRLKGFTNPLSPRGTASTVEPTPHFISADALRVTFRAGEDVARDYLPDGLEPVDGGLGFAYVADMLKVSADEPEQTYKAPQRTQYGEGIIGFYCEHDGVRGRFSAFIWVDKDWSMQFGTVMGWPKKIGTIHRTRLNPYNPAMGPVGPGTRLKGTVHRQGKLVFEVGVKVEREEQPGANAAQHGQRAYLLRHIPSVGPKLPEIRQLVALPLGQSRTGDMFSGEPHLLIGDADNEDLEPLRDVELVRGDIYKSGWQTDTVLELLRDYND